MVKEKYEQEKIIDALTSKEGKKEEKRKSLEKIINNSIYFDKFIEEMNRNNVNTLEEMVEYLEIDYYKNFVFSYPILLFNLPVQKIKIENNEYYSKKFISFTTDENGNLIIIEDKYISLETEIAKEKIDGLKRKEIKNLQTIGNWSILSIKSKRKYNLNGIEIERDIVSNIERKDLYQGDAKKIITSPTVTFFSLKGLEKSTIRFIRNDDLGSVSIYRKRGNDNYEAKFVVKLEGDKINTLNIPKETHDLIEDQIVKIFLHNNQDKTPAQLSFNTGEYTLNFDEQNEYHNWISEAIEKIDNSQTKEYMKTIVSKEVTKAKIKVLE